MSAWKMGEEVGALSLGSPLSMMFEESSQINEMRSSDQDLETMSTSEARTHCCEVGRDVAMRCSPWTHEMPCYNRA